MSPNKRRHVRTGRPTGAPIGNAKRTSSRHERLVSSFGARFIVRERDGDIEDQVQRLPDEEGLTDRDLLVILRSEDATTRGDRAALWINTGVPHSEGFGR